MKYRALAVLTISFFVAGSSYAAESSNRIGLNGLVPNRIGLNGLTTNRIAPNRIGLNGISLNGVKPKQDLPLRDALRALARKPLAG